MAGMEVRPLREGSEIRGLGGLLVWGPISSVGVLTGGAILSDGGSTMPGLMVFFVMLSLLVAALVWAVGGVFVAVPVWMVLVRSGLRGRALALATTLIGAAVVATIWVWIAAPAREALDSAAMVAAMGAISGAAGGFGFYRAGARAPRVRP